MNAQHCTEVMSEVKKLKFPDGFRWGTATASYQIEGGIDDRGRTIWDEFCDTPGKVFEAHNGTVACDHYNRYKEDVGLLKDLGAPYYRFSLSWARLFPAEGEVSEKGIKFYRDLIEGLLANNIKPIVTLYHWDLPSWVEKKVGGWTSTAIVAEFVKFARAAFDSLNDLVDEWITINEPWCIAVLGYEIGEHAPGRIDKPGVNVYLVAHNLLLAHAHTVQLFKNEFNNGSIGITLNCDWAEPKDGATDAARRDMEFSLGWFANPVYFGEYPKCMREEIGDRLPKFSAEESDMLKGSSDFFGLNHYSTHYTTGIRVKDEDTVSLANDKRTVEVRDPNWARTDMGWAIVPRGFSRLLTYISDTYNPKGGILVTENGLAVKEDTLDEVHSNNLRLSYYQRYIGAVHEAIQNGADVRGYLLWSFLDNFEWAYGYSKRFGLFHVDYQTLARTPKPAVQWYKTLIKENAIEIAWTDDEMGLLKENS